jgi:hypothetical protein
LKTFWYGWYARRKADRQRTGRSYHEPLRTTLRAGGVPAGQYARPYWALGRG